MSPEAKDATGLIDLIIMPYLWVHYLEILRLPTLSPHSPA